MRIWNSLADVMIDILADIIGSIVAIFILAFSSIYLGLKNWLKRVG